MNEWLSTLVPALGQVLLDFLWQGALIGLVAAVLLHVLRDARAQLRYAVACLAMLACAVVPLLGLAWSLGQGGAMDEAASANASRFTGTLMPMLTAASDGIAAWRLEDALPAIVAAWACGACIFSLRMAMGVWWIQRLCAAPQPSMQQAWQARLDAVAAKFGFARQVALRLVESLDTPAAVGWIRPVVLLPVAIANRMPVELVEALLAHELAHIRRHDYLVNLLQGAVEAMLFYHPVTWWLSRRIRIEREHIADQLAAQAIGEPRRLARALYELSEHAATPPAPSLAAPSLALAAQGGHLMSRIEQLVRPASRRNGGRIAFPLIGLVAASLAFYAHAQIDGAAKNDPVADGDKANYIRLRDDHKGPSYAIVRKGREGMTMSGSGDDIDEIRAARSKLGSDFIWFRKDNQAFVVSDPAMVQRATQAWAEADKLGDRMGALGDQMEVHGRKMEALGEQMEGLAEGPEGEAMEAAGTRMEELGRRQGEVAARQAELATAMIDADEAGRARLQREMDALGKQMETLSAQMDEQARVMDTHSERLEARMRPMEALGRQMEEAGKPMEALGEQMDALGEQMDKLSEKAEKETLALIDEAVAKGLAKPVPAK